jgi:predicted helicase
MKHNYLAVILVRDGGYRPYAPRRLYHSEVFTDELGLADELFPPEGENKGISFSAPGFRTNYRALAVNGVADLHFGAAVDGYQQVTRYRFEGDQTPRVVLRADHETGIIVLDSETQLSGVPSKAWNYKLGNRSALDWVLDQHKERRRSAQREANKRCRHPTTKAPPLRFRSS